jgi:hypothetical protein
MNEDNPNSMTYWWPRVKDVDVPKPRTALMEHGPEVGHKLAQALENEVPMSSVKKYLHRVYLASLNFERPVFVRGDQMAGKHSWKDTCYIEEADEPSFHRHLMALVEDHELKLWLEGPRLLAFAVREFIKTEPVFYAFYGQMPITRERRMFFVKGEGVVCHHPYWPNDAITEGTPNSLMELAPRDWRLKMEEMNELSVAEETHLCRTARTIGEALATDEHPAWSIDLLESADGVWYFTDCAVAERSFHWIGCEEAIKRGWPQSP